MGVKISQLKQDEIKTTIVIDTVDGEQEIIIKNPIGKTKEDIMNFVKGGADDEANIQTDEMIVYLLSRLTNIDIDVDDIGSILETPSQAMTEVLKHINEIMHDVVYELMVEQTIQLSMLQKSLMGKELSEKMASVTDMINTVSENI